MCYKRCLLLTGKIFQELQKTVMAFTNLPVSTITIALIVFPVPLPAYRKD